VKTFLTEAIYLPGQVLAELAGSNDLMSRDTHCNGIKTSITNSINNFKIGKAAFEASTEAIAGLLTAYQLSSSVLEISFLAAEAFEIIGVMGTGIIMTIAVCEAFGKACDLFPKAVVESSAAMAGKLNWSAGAALVAKWAQEGYKKGSPFYKAIDAGIVLSGALVAGAFTANKYIEIVLDGGITYFQAALECCGDDCASAVCQQAGQACLLNTGAFWGGSPAKGLNCGAF
jgi:hypothetical protein